MGFSWAYFTFPVHHNWYFSVPPLRGVRELSGRLSRRLAGTQFQNTGIHTSGVDVKEEDLRRAQQSYFRLQPKLHLYKYTEAKQNFNISTTPSLVQTPIRLGGIDGYLESACDF